MNRDDLICSAPVNQGIRCLNLSPRCPSFPRSDQDLTAVVTKLKAIATTVVNHVDVHLVYPRPECHARRVATFTRLDSTGERGVIAD